ncbi:hypothetical protein RSOL_039610, partial [Rhizoctonia solani AG-3 Rhs1AP]
MPHRFPDPIAYIYDGFRILPENITLDTEDPRPAAEGQVKVRVLDGFLFEKGSKFVYPRADYPTKWWEDVTAFGYTASVTGDFRYFIWAGQWNQSFSGKHIEVVILGSLIGITKEANVHWRNGMEDILWLDTKLGYSYALMEPSEEYDRGGWACVTASWMEVPDPGHPSDPKFVKICQHDPRPVWWDQDGDEAWDVLHGRPQMESSTGSPARRLVNQAVGGGTRGLAPDSAEFGSSDEGDSDITFLGFRAAPPATGEELTAAKPDNGRLAEAKANKKRLQRQVQTLADKDLVNFGDGERCAPFEAKKVTRGQNSVDGRQAKKRAMPKSQRKSINGANLKQQVPTGRPKAHKRQKVVHEVIYVGSSDEEAGVTSSPPPVPSSPISHIDAESSLTTNNGDLDGWPSCALIQSAHELKGKTQVGTNNDQGEKAEKGKQVVGITKGGSDGRFISAVCAIAIADRKVIAELLNTNPPMTRAQLDKKINETIKRLCPYAKM